MSSLYALPLPVSRQPPGAREESKAQRRKRKRSKPQTSRHDSEVHGTEQKDGLDTDSDDINDEYRAVLNNDQRTQYRLAQLSFKKPLPKPPFPHKDTTSAKARKQRSVASVSGTEMLGQSLRIQHIAAMTALLHQCVQKRDWTRARRAFGLLLRTEISGQFIDIRAADLWGIGAEILFRQHPDAGKLYSRHGFETAKNYYEALVIRYPWHRSAPDSINSVDFYLAMFSLWIFVCQAEKGFDQEDDGLPHDTRTQELQEAADILSRLQKITAQAPFANNEHFNKLKTDVQLWHANLERDRKLYSPVAANSPEDGLTAAN